MNAYIKMFKISNGDFIFLLDSDDKFYKKKNFNNHQPLL